MTSDEVVETWLAHLTALRPLGAVTRTVWDYATDPAKHMRVIGQVCGKLEVYMREECITAIPLSLRSCSDG